MSNPFFPSLALALSLCLAPLAAEGIDREFRPVKPQRTSMVEALDPPAGEASILPVVTQGQGAVLLSWLEQSATGVVSLRVSSWGGATWGFPRQVHEIHGVVNEPFDPPMVIDLGGGRQAATWVEGAAGARRVWLARRENKAKNYDKPELIAPTAEGVSAELARVVAAPAALAPTLAVVAYVQRGDATGLWVAPITDTGLGERRCLDACVSAGCPPALAATDSAVVVAFRDDAGETHTRPIAFARLDAKGWSTPAEVAADAWAVEDAAGAGLAATAREDRVAVAWVTVSEGEPILRLAISEPAATGFGAARDLRRGAVTGAMGAAWPDATLVVAASAMTDEGEALTAHFVPPEGEVMGPLVVVGATDYAASAISLIGHDGQVMVAWSSPHGRRLRAGRVFRTDLQEEKK